MVGSPLPLTYIMSITFKVPWDVIILNLINKKIYLMESISYCKKTLRWYDDSAGREALLRVPT